MTSRTADAMLYCAKCKSVTEHSDAGGRDDRRVSRCMCLECGTRREAVNMISSVLKGISVKGRAACPGLTRIRS